MYCQKSTAQKNPWQNLTGKNEFLWKCCRKFPENTDFQWMSVFPRVREAFEDILKETLVTVINLLREGTMPDPELTELISAVVASYLIAHSLLPLAPDNSREQFLYSRYKTMEIGTFLSTPLLIDVLIAEILTHVKEHVEEGTFNAVPILMAVHNMHRDSTELVVKHDAETCTSPPALDVSVNARKQGEDLRANRKQDQDKQESQVVNERNRVSSAVRGNRPFSKEEASLSVLPSTSKPEKATVGTSPLEKDASVRSVKYDTSSLNAEAKKPGGFQDNKMPFSKGPRRRNFTVWCGSSSTDEDEDRNYNQNSSPRMSSVNRKKKPTKKRTPRRKQSCLQNSSTSMSVSQKLSDSIPPSRGSSSRKIPSRTMRSVQMSDERKLSSETASRVDKSLQEQVTQWQQPPNPDEIQNTVQVGHA